jgi:hypothetical protein
MKGTAAVENMDLAFGENWQTISGSNHYPELIALSDADANKSLESSTSIVDEYIGDHEDVESFDVITALGDLRQQQLGPFVTLDIIAALWSKKRNWAFSIFHRGSGVGVTAGQRSHFLPQPKVKHDS